LAVVPVLASTWSDAFSAAGATAAVAATVGGAVIAARYGRKATAQVEGTAYEAAGTAMVVVRPSVRAVGVFRLVLTDDDGCSVTVTEVWATPDGLSDGRQWRSEAVFGPNFAEGGETVSTTVVFDVGPPHPQIVGWRGVLDVAVARKFRRDRVWTWDDRIFVPAPATKSVT
jgi:hypothetical protein